MCTHYDGASGGLTVDVLVSQVEDQCGGAIKEPEHTDTHKELCRGGEVALQEGLVGCTAATCRYVIRVLRQPAGRQRRERGRRSFQQVL